jgi:uncharacterized protein
VSATHAPLSECDDIISSITIILSDKCNMNCKYCYVDSDSANTQVIDYLALSRFLHSLFDNNHPPDRTVQFHFYGGEPLLHYDKLKAIVADIKGLGIAYAFTLTTNGVLLDMTRLEYLVDNDFFVTISLDGPEYIHDAYRLLCDNTPTHKIVVSKIHMIMRHYRHWMKTNLSINSVLTPGSSILERQEYFSSLGIIRVNFIEMVSESISCTGITKSLYYDYYLEQQSLLCEYVNMKLISKQYGDIIAFPFSNYYDLFRHKRGTDCKAYCGIGKKRLAIMPTGEIIPCLQFASSKALAKTFVIGSIRTGIDMKLVSKMHEEYVQTSEKCCGCWLFFLCSRLCPYQVNTKKESYCSKDRYDFIDSLITLYINAYAKIQLENPNVLIEYAEFTNGFTNSKFAAND